MSKWEYFYISLEPSNLNRHWLDLLNNYGKDGWELVAVIYLGSNFNREFYFKRPIND